MPERGAATTLGAVHEAEDALDLRWCEYRAAQIRLAQFNGPVKRYNDAQDAYWIAARDLVNAIDELPPEKRPKNWGLGPDGEVA